MIIPSGDVGSLITGGAALAGAGVGWLASWTAGQRSRAETRDDRRRAAYAAFIRTAEELTRLLVAGDTMETPPAPDSLFGENVARLVGSVDREYVTVLLTGPEQARAAADDVRQKAWALLNWLRPQGQARSRPGNALAELGALAGEYARACERFTAFAQRMLGGD